MNILLLSIQCFFLYNVVVAGNERLASHRYRRNVQGGGKADAINKVRTHVIEYVTKNPNSIHEFDVNRVKTRDWFIDRYLQDYNGDVIAAQNALLASLKYFKTERLHEIDDSYFPSEIWGTGMIILKGNTLQGAPVENGLFKCILTPTANQGPEYMELFLKYMTYMFFKVSVAGENGAHVINQLMGDVLPINLDIAFYTKLGKVIAGPMKQSRFKGIISDTNILIEPVVKIVLGLLGIKDLTFIRSSELKKYLKLETIPTFYGGTLRYNPVPANSKPGRCLPHLKAIPNTVWTSVREQHMKCIQEAMAEVGVKNINEYLHNC